MNHCRIIIRIVFGILFFLTIGCKSSQDRKNNNSVYDFSPIDQKISGWVDKGYYLGASIIIYKDSQKIHEAYFGNYKPETVVFIASAGKWLAAATIAAVVEEGKLSWDDKVVKWLPEFTDTKGQATLRQLFSHTSGYPDYQPKGNHRDDYQTLEESVKHIVSLPADTIPGTQFHYGGLAMQVAGRMGELATGKDFETIFQEKIAQPLGMKKTHFTPVDLGGGHSPMLGGGARSTLHDYAHFLEMIANDGMYKGRAVLKKTSVQEMQADQVKNALVRKGEYVENARALTHKSIYGLGEWREELDDKGEAVLISSPSWAGAYPWIDKKNNVYGFLLTHVIPEVANKEGFSSFLSSHIMATMTRDIISKDENRTTGKIKIGDKELYYEMKGKGQPLVFLHGHSFDSSMWDKQFEYFSKKYKVIRYDLRGYGYSDNPVEGEDFLHAEDLNSLLEQLKIKKAHLVGLSLGSFVVGDFMALHTEKILSATLASGAFYNNPGPSIPILEAEILKRRQEISALKKEGIQKFKQNWLNGLLNSSSGENQELKYSMWKEISQWSVWQPLHIEPRLLLGQDLKNRIDPTKIHFKSLFIYGDKDSKYSHKSSDELAELVPNVKKVILQNSGHMSNMETPNEFNSALENFLLH